jgi:non-ribosomal peptide synthetase component F
MAILDLNRYGLLPIFLVSLLLLIAATEIGRWLGKRAGGRVEDNVPTLEGAVLGLLALMIGFTFAMALSRFEAHRDAVLDEANAIGSTALRARLLPAPYNAECIKLLKSYVQVRLDITQHVLSPAELDAAVTRSNEIQEALWQQAKTAAATDNGMVPTGLFIQSLNDMFDNQAKHLSAIRDRVPNLVFLTLYGIAAVASALAGYASGLGRRPSQFPVYVMIVLVCALVLLIQDLNRPLNGFIEVSQQPMIDTAAIINAYSE